LRCRARRAAHAAAAAHALDVRQDAAMKSDDDRATEIVRQAMRAALAAEGSATARIVVALEVLAAATSDRTAAHAAAVLAGSRPVGAVPKNDTVALSEVAA